jgi:hypothetical protein
LHQLIDFCKRSILYISKTYLDGFLKEAGKDHYQLFKEYLPKFAHRILRIKGQTFVSSQSPDKLREDNPVSNSFAIQLKTLDGRPLKFMFIRDREEDYYRSYMDEIYNVLSDHARQYPNDYISTQADRLPRRSREIYMLFDESIKRWKAADIGTGKFLN